MKSDRVSGHAELDHRAIIDGADGRVEGRRLLWLPRARQDTLPSAAQWVHDAWTCRHESRNGNVHDAVVHESHGEARVAGHYRLE